ncbi:MAG: hypothetical protein PHH04_02180 [Thomasclavelia sp.]|nr:hypothetical protein [Thomasclavelia sp.]
MKKLLSAVLVCLVAVSLMGCGASTKTVKGTVVKATIPDDWSLVDGKKMNGAGGADYICDSKEYKAGDPYLNISESSKSISDLKALLKDGTLYGKYYGDVKLDNGTWYLAKNAAVAKVNKKTFIVTGYKCDFNSDEVQDILGSLKWVKASKVVVK